ncbi:MULTISPECIES: FAD-dependent tricarballylate dehydrogenase TcuA [unclassified Arthrobacter]|jgi:tricarballylate dehydrogenase|uniref:FAD-dependent tricarballylate dehydrogenase TcuA n=1 Tax=unclassified Arthrobacter TaxID=235627 RepID=UPI0009A91172|nr:MULTISPECIES: FAD-dependent tricarballylate dehydrogenase TcuA [unclassified Arthrobacter]PNH82981.1 FAD-dependent tricarballylate dehydrogenase TcuA [Arthrobacter sp. AFG20]SLK04488.1 tricarballylate dehydrogenase [Arthrobacter sp. P2b]
MTEKYDVVVVGGASAGFAAAAAAKEAGAEKVLVLEKATRDLVGGNCRYSLMGFRFVHDGTDELMQLIPEHERAEHARARVAPYTKEKFIADLNRVTRGRIDSELAEVLADDSRDAIAWMTSLGHKWRFRNPVDMGDYTHYDPGTAVCPVDGGLGLVERWIKIAEGMGIDFRTESSVTGLLGDYRGVHGVQVDGPQGRYEVECDSVILASGGFQASAERRGRYLEQNADLMKVRGSRHNTGEVLQMAIDLGAKTAGQWQGAHASPVDLDTPPAEIDDSVNRYAYPFGITVNAEAKRFFDEAEAHRTYTYAKTGWAVLRENGGYAFQIYDQKSVEYFPVEYAQATPIVADSIPELAEKLGLDPAALTTTVDEFNSAIDQSVPFDATKDDGRRTHGLTPNKSNWCLTIEEGPFLAYRVTAGITFTFGGLAVNRDSQVLNQSGQPMKGLFATGDILGLFFHNYPSCTGMTRNVVFGGRAGAAAAGVL